MVSVLKVKRERKIHAVIPGATSIVGRYLIKRLAKQGFTGVALTRSLNLPLEKLPIGFSWQTMSTTDLFPDNKPSILISLMPISALPSILLTIKNTKHLIALSTSSTAYKFDSSDKVERDLVFDVLEAEKKIQKLCKQKKIKCTIFRPTLIYDPGRDKNISAIAHFITRFKVFPVVSPGKGKRQPIHAEDVADAMVTALINNAAIGKVFDLPGGETLTYKEMVNRIFVSLDIKPFFIYMPLRFAKIVFFVWKIITKTQYSPASLERMNRDLTFDIKPVTDAIGIKCRAFFPKFWDNCNGD